MYILIFQERKIIKNRTHLIFSLYILKEDFSIFFSLFKMDRSKT